MSSPTDPAVIRSVLPDDLARRAKRLGLTVDHDFNAIVVRRHGRARIIGNPVETAYYLAGYQACQDDRDRPRIGTRDV